MYLELTENETELLTNFDKDGRYCIYLSKRFPNWEYRLMDFITYHNAISYEIEVNVTKEDLRHAKAVYGNSSFNDKLREYEKAVLIHTTTKENWENIRKSMLLKSWNKAKHDGDITEKEAIGDLLKDPDMFKNYVMLGRGSYHNEIIVLCKQLGTLVFDKNHIYEPGARMYINASKLADNNLLYRDGLHYFVKNQLSLNKYMIDVVTPQDLIIEEFTPFVFSYEADKLFKERHK